MNKCKQAAPRLLQRKVKAAIRLSRGNVREMDGVFQRLLFSYRHRSCLCDIQSQLEVTIVTFDDRRPNTIYVSHVCIQSTASQAIFGTAKDYALRIVASH